jgi:hypothetical protein
VRAAQRRRLSGVVDRSSLVWRVVSFLCLITHGNLRLEVAVPHRDDVSAVWPVHDFEYGHLSTRQIHVPQRVFQLRVQVRRLVIAIGLRQKLTSHDRVECIT